MQKTLEAAERQNFLLQQRLSQLEQLLAEAGRKESKGQDSKESSKAIEKLERITNLVQRRNKDKAMPERRTGSNADRIGSKADHTGKAHHTGKADHTGRANLTGKANQTGKANHTGRADRKESKYLKSSDYLAERGKSVYREKEKLQEIDDFWPPGLKTEHSRDSFCSEEAHSNDV